LSLRKGFYKVPAGVYFSGTQFSILAWVRMKSIGYSIRLIDFGNGQQNENVVLSLSLLYSGKPFFYFHSVDKELYGYSTKELVLNQWKHIACVFSFPYYFIYIDGIEVTQPGSQTSHASFSLTNIVRSSNFIGKDNWQSDEYADGDFDELEIFNRALTKEEIIVEMNYNL
jgi:hypothetical protein